MLSHLPIMISFCIMNITAPKFLKSGAKNCKNYFLTAQESMTKVFIQKYYTDLGYLVLLLEFY